MTHDYKRNGTTDLFAALNVATGEVLYDTRRSHTAADVLAFFKLIDLHVPRRPRRPRRVGQPLGPQGPTGRRLARPPQAGALAPALHADLLVVAEPGRALVPDPHPASPEEPQPHGRQRPRRSDRSMGRTLEQQPRPFTWTKPIDEVLTKIRGTRTALTESATHHLSAICVGYHRASSAHCQASEGFLDVPKAGVWRSPRRPFPRRVLVTARCSLAPSRSPTTTRGPRASRRSCVLTALWCRVRVRRHAEDVGVERGTVDAQPRPRQPRAPRVAGDEARHHGRALSWTTRAGAGQPVAGPRAASCVLIGLVVPCPSSVACERRWRRAWDR